MAEVDADVWVLTETHLNHRPGGEFIHSAFSPAHLERRPEHERWTAIWSRWPIEELTDPAAHRRGTVAAIVHAPDGPLIVYGTVIAWANEPHFDDGSPARMWQVHMAEIERQAADWRRIRELHPELPLVVLGDFNQDRDGSGWYGTAATRSALGAGLEAADLLCITTADAVAEGWLQRLHLVDHICATPELADRADVTCWEPIDADGQRLSDHPTVAIDV
jgi:endonuclease/exonuclease/phosphatase family metal-dependent hydrolase